MRLFHWLRDLRRYRWLRRHYELIRCSNAPFVSDRQGKALDEFCDKRRGGKVDGRTPDQPVLFFDDERTVPG